MGSLRKHGAVCFWVLYRGALEPGLCFVAPRYGYGGIPRRGWEETPAWLGGSPRHGWGEKCVCFRRIYRAVDVRSPGFMMGENCGKHTGTDTTRRNGGLRRYQESAEYIREKLCGRVPQVLMILGSGLGYLGDEVEDAVRIPYHEIPHFRASTAPGHAGQLVCGMLAGKCVLVMQGRMHYYEGYSPEEIVYPVRVAKLLGAETMMITNASGGINRDFHVGDIMLIRDHIKLMGDSPLRGENLCGFGVRFPDMTYAYAPELWELAREAARSVGTPLREGVYFYAQGPQYETPAEIRAMRVLGADAVGMSTAPEVIAAAHMGMKTLGFSLISNMASGILNQPLSGEEVIAAGEAARERFSALVIACLKKMEG